ncbi:MAG: hypothetical protein ACRC30_01390 [Clostridium sp.]
MVNVDEFISKGTLIGEGPYNYTYELGKYVCVIAKGKFQGFGRIAIQSQIEVWNLFKNKRRSRNILLPILDYKISEELSYYIQPKCYRKFDSHGNPVFKILEYDDYKSVVNINNDNYPLESIVADPENQGVFNGRTVIIMYGMTFILQCEFRLATEGFSPVKIQLDKDNHFKSIFSSGELFYGEISGTMKKGIVHIEKVDLYEKFRYLDVELLMVDELRKKYIIKDERKHQ